MIGGFWEFQQRLQNPMDMGRVQQVFTARDQRDALQRVINDNSQMITGANILARQNHVAAAMGLNDDTPARLICKGQGFQRSVAIKFSHGFRHIQPKRITGAAID